MADRYFNRDRNRPYDNDFDDEFYDRDFDEDRGFGDREFGYGRNYGYGQGRHGRSFDRNTGYGGYNRDFGFNRGMNRGYGGGGYGGYGMNRGYGDYESTRFGGYGRGHNFDNDFESGRWNRGGYSGGGYGRYGGSGFGRGARRDFSGGYGQQSGGYGRGSYGGYGSDFEEYDYDTEFDSDFTPTSWSYSEVWIIPGPFSGIGPEDYQRSDDRIREDVHDRLTQHGQIDARKIQVDVQNGEVTLKGTVNNRQAKRQAEDMAESVWGVKDIHNQLRVQERQSSATSRSETQRLGQGQQSQGQMTGEEQGSRQRSTNRS